MAPNVWKGECNEVIVRSLFCPDSAESLVATVYQGSFAVEGSALDVMWR
jgi:hypothetical protein